MLLLFHLGCGDVDLQAARPIDFVETGNCRWFPHSHTAVETDLGLPDNRIVADRVRASGRHADAADLNVALESQVVIRTSEPGIDVHSDVLVIELRDSAAATRGDGHARTNASRLPSGVTVDNHLIGTRVDLFA